MKTAGRIFLIVFILTFKTVSSQVSLSLMDYRPTGDFGFLFNSLVSAEIGYAKKFTEEKRFRLNFGLGYLHMQPRMNPFPVSGFNYNPSQGAGIVDGAEIFSRFDLININGGVDFAVYHYEKIHCYIGTDIVTGIGVVDYSDVIPGVQNDRYKGAMRAGGIRFRTGVEYEINERYSAFLNIQRTYGFLEVPQMYYNANEYGIGVRYLIHYDVN